MNQVEIKRKQIQFFSYCLAGINVWVFGKQLGNNGLAYLAAAFLVFLFFWILTGKNVPDRLGRLLRSRNAKGQYKNVSKMRRNMMIFQIAAGLVGAVLCAALGYFVLEKAFRIPYGSMILWILCPALILRCMQSVLLGIFQSEGSEMPSAVSAILRQVFYFGLGLLFLGIFRTYGEKVSLLLKKDDFTAMYGAMGVALGIVISEVLVLIFVFVIYQVSASGRREAEIGMKGTDTFFSQVGFCFSVWAVISSATYFCICRYGQGSFYLRKMRRIFMQLQTAMACLSEDIWIQCFWLWFFYAWESYRE